MSLFLRKTRLHFMMICLVCLTKRRVITSLVYRRTLTSRQTWKKAQARASISFSTSKQTRNMTSMSAKSKLFQECFRTWGDSIIPYSLQVSSFTHSFKALSIFHQSLANCIKLSRSPRNLLARGVRIQRALMSSLLLRLNMIVNTI